MNAGIQHEETRRSSSGSMRREVERARRRSSIRMNLNLNDPSVPAPGEMQRSPSSRSRGGSGLATSPHHERAPSLGELHQELEYEQEGQVNRLLNMIRQQQAQISTLQGAQQQQPSSSAVDDSTPTSERSMSLPYSSSAHPSHAAISPMPISPLPMTNHPRSHSPFALGSISRQSSFADRSRGGSHTGSPSLRPMSGTGGVHNYDDMLPGSATGRDESAFYQAETQNLTRENQMLKLRIRELGMLWSSVMSCVWTLTCRYRTTIVRHEPYKSHHADSCCTLDAEYSYEPGRAGGESIDQLAQGDES